MVIGKQETFLLKGEYKEMAYKIIETPVEGKVYYLSIGSSNELEIEYFFGMNEALTYLLDQINNDKDISLEGFSKSGTRNREYLDGNVETEEYQFDTLSTFSEKINYLLSN